jgi:hypothetical protein
VPVLAAAAAVAVVVVGIAFAVSAWPKTVAGPSGADQPVPWVALPATHPDPKATRVPASPDPAIAAALPGCRATDLRANVEPNGAGGTRYLMVNLTAASPCRVSGVPAVTALGPDGSQVDVPQLVQTGPYLDAVAVGPAPNAVIVLSWPSAWCAAPVTVAKLRIDIGSGGGPLTVDGFGESTCSAPGSGNEKAPISVGSFQPIESSPAHEETVFSGVRARVDLPPSVPAGQPLHFTVTLTAPPDRDVPLDVCPDYAISIGEEGNYTSTEYALNCAAEPHRNADGVRILPAGVEVTFAMVAVAPPRPGGGAKLVWQLSSLRNIDNVVGGGTIDVT